MTCVIYFKCFTFLLAYQESTLIYQHLFSKFGLVWTGDHGATNRCKIVDCSSYYCGTADAPFSWAAQHTTVCLDIHSYNILRTSISKH